MGYSKVDSLIVNKQRRIRTVPTDGWGPGLLELFNVLVCFIVCVFPVVMKLWRVGVGTTESRLSEPILVNEMVSPMRPDVEDSGGLGRSVDQGLSPQSDH